MKIIGAKSRCPDGHSPCTISIDHVDKWVVVGFEEDELSFSPGEAKALAAALVHYAERAQKIRDRGDVD